jgi:hypothetical protein
MPELREVFEMVTKQTEPDVDAWREQEQRQRRTSRNRKWGALVAAAAISIAVVFVATRLADGGAHGEPATPPSTTEPSAEEIANRFVESYGAFDAEAALSYLADDADISVLMRGPQDGQGLEEDLSLNLSMLKAQGYVQISDSCQSQGTSWEGTYVRCAFAYHLLGSDRIGLGPFEGSTFKLTIQDGEIVRASLDWANDEFSPQMWDPFSEWVSANYPDDAEVMYAYCACSGASGFAIQNLTERSIRLWRLHVAEYVDHVTGN